MLFRHIAVALLSLISLPALACVPSEVRMETAVRGPSRPGEGSNLWVYQEGWPHAAVGGGVLLIHAPVPWVGLGGQFVMPACNRFVFHHERTMYTWDGVYRYFEEPTNGSVPLFTNDRPLGEIVPLRNGHFVVAEEGGGLVEFDTRGRVVKRADAGTNIAHFDVLADQCTVLYTASPGDRRVRRFDGCTGESLPDFAWVLGGNGHAIRALPDGNVLVANGHGVEHFSVKGTSKRFYPAEGATHVALNERGDVFWAGGVNERTGKAFLRRFDFTNEPADDIPLGNPEMQTTYIDVRVTDLVVANEWRASLSSTALAQGDVIVVSGKCLEGACAEDLLVAQPVIHVVSADGNNTREVFSFGANQPEDFEVRAERLVYAPAPNLIYFDHWSRLYVSRDFQTRTPVVTDDGVYSFAPMKSGNFLAMLHDKGLVEITPTGQIVDQFSHLRAWELELLADQCTLLYGNEQRQVARFNICTRRQEPAFATPQGYVEAIRAIPGGDILVAAGKVYRFSPRGELKQTWDINAKSLSLTPDGNSFWTTSVFGDVTRESLTNPLDRIVLSQFFSGATAAAVVGEWRAATAKPRGRTIRR